MIQHFLPSVLSVFLVFLVSWPVLVHAGDTDSDGPGKLDVTFNYGAGADAGVLAAATQSDGKILIAGHFYNYAGQASKFLARLNADGSFDAGFDQGGGVQLPVETLVIQPDKKIVIGGWFYRYNYIVRNRVARLNADGSLDSGFDPGMGPDRDVYAADIQPDGKVLIGGAFKKVSGITRNYLARLNADGSLDLSFNPGFGADNVIEDIVVQPDGRVLIAGSFSSYNGVARQYIARVNADGSLDHSFDPGGGASGTVFKIALQADGKIFIAGYFDYYNGNGVRDIARLNADGSYDPGFNTDSWVDYPNQIENIVIQPDGKVIISGAFSSIDGNARNNIARLNADGSLDHEFNPGIGADNRVSALTVQKNGRLIVAGHFVAFDGVAINRVASVHTGDKDQDGVEDAGDGFDNAAAATDNDGDGKPDAWLQPNPYGCAAGDVSCNGLMLDPDDDNDGIPDSFDPAPLDPNSVAPLDGIYQGSVIRESQSVQ